jgi:hypothetical protein
MTAGEPDLDQTFVRNDVMVGQRIADEYILIPTASGNAAVGAIFDLNRVGAFIWERLDGHRTGREIVGEIAGHFEVEPSCAAQDYWAFMTQLRTIGAIELASEP